MAANCGFKSLKLLNWTKRINASISKSTSSIFKRELCVQADHVMQLLSEETAKQKESVQGDSQMEIDKAKQVLKHPDYFNVHKLVNVESLFKKRVHFGHHKGCRDPFMAPYIFGTRFDVDIIDLDKTLSLFQDALNFVSHMAYRDGIILIVSKNRIIMPEVEKTAVRVKEYAHCRHWHEGLFTNCSKMFKTAPRLPDLCIFLNTLDNVFEMHPGITECSKLLIPTVGVVDTNCDPRLISYPIPGNDDTVDSLMYYLQLFEKAIILGKKKRFEDGLVEEDFEVSEAVDNSSETKVSLNVDDKEDGKVEVKDENAKQEENILTEPETLNNTGLDVDGDVDSAKGEIRDENRNIFVEQWLSDTVEKEDDITKKESTKDEKTKK